VRTRPELIEGGQTEAVPDVSVVVPAHNEFPSIELLAGRVRDVLDREGRTWELIVVDDGSDDGTADALHRLRAEDPRFRARILRSRHGKSAALRVGFAAARGSIVVTMDADLQDLPEELPTMLAGIEEQGFDVVQAWRKERNDPGFKVFASWVFNSLCSAFSGLRLRDVNCGFKAMTRDAARTLDLGADLHRFIPVLLHRRGFAVGEVSVRHARRAFGHSKYGVLRYFRGFNDLIGVVLLPRLLLGVAPLLAPVAVVSFLGAVAFAVALGVMLALGHVGLLWETGLSALGLSVAGLLCLSLSLLSRTAFAEGQADRTRNVDVAESLG